MTMIGPRRLVPSLSALQAFEAAARHGSFTRAAEELDLTQGAVSRQVAQLEDTLGAPLFERIRQRVTLTPAGAAYAQDVREALSRTRCGNFVCHDDTRRRRRAGARHPATFGTRWLIPRCRASSHAIQRSRSTSPRASCRSTSHWRGWTRRSTSATRSGLERRCIRSWGETIVPVASPDLVREAGLTKPADLLRVPLLQQATRPRAWAEWLAAQALPPDRAVMGPSFEQFAMVAQAAVAGLGAAVVPRFLVEDEIASGRLVVPFDKAIESRQGYWLVYPAAKRDRPPSRPSAPGCSRSAAGLKPPERPALSCKARSIEGSCARLMKRVVHDPAASRIAA